MALMQYLVVAPIPSNEPQFDHAAQCAFEFLRQRGDRFRAGSVVLRTRKRDWAAVMGKVKDLFRCEAMSFIHDADKSFWSYRRKSVSQLKQHVRVGAMLRITTFGPCDEGQIGDNRVRFAQSPQKGLWYVAEPRLTFGVRLNENSVWVAGVFANRVSSDLQCFTN